MTSLRLSFDLPIFHLPCSNYYTFLHVLTISMSFVKLSRICLPYLPLVISPSVLIVSILFIPIIHLNILISVLPSRSCPAFLVAQVSLSHTITCLTTYIYTDTLMNQHASSCRIQLLLFLAISLIQLRLDV